MLTGWKMKKKTNCKGDTHTKKKKKKINDSMNERMNERFNKRSESKKMEE